MKGSKVVMAAAAAAFLMAAPGAEALPLLGDAGQAARAGGDMIQTVNRVHAGRPVAHPAYRPGAHPGVRPGYHPGYRPPGGYHPGYRPGVRPPVAVVPPRGVWVGRPGWYRWAPGGAIAAGAAIGFVTAAAAASYASAPPQPGLCWYYTDPSRTQGFWDACP